MSIDVFGSCAESEYARDTKMTYKEGESESEVAQSCTTLCDPMDSKREVNHS